jgi:arylsulfatase A-like enzyme
MARRSAALFRRPDFRRCPLASRLRTALNAFLAAAVVAAGSLLVAGCPPRRPTAPVASPAGPLNVVVIVVDTLRADHMSAYGYQRPTTPNLDSLADELIVFARARSQAACTFPSVNSLLTSRYPAPFIRQGKGEMGIPPEIPSLADLLHRRGYATLAVSASPIVRSTPSKENPLGGFGSGFDAFDESPLWREGAFVNHIALTRLASLTEPFFLYLHYMDAHDSYRPPKTWTRRFATRDMGPEFIRLGDPNPIAAMIYGSGPPVTASADDIQHLVDLYDDEIGYADLQIAKLIRRLEARGLADHTILVLAADHGEEFMEHGHVKHCRVLYDSSTRVPLMLRIPGVPGGRRIEAAVQNVDIVPTVLDYLGMPSPPARFDGRSLRPLVEGRPQRPPWVAFSGQGKWRSADDGRYKVIMDGVTLDEQLFDLRADPQEHHDLWAAHLREASVLDRRLREWLQETLRGFGRKRALEAARSKEEQLRALGYLQ